MDVECNDGMGWVEHTGPYASRYGFDIYDGVRPCGFVCTGRVQEKQGEEVKRKTKDRIWAGVWIVVIAAWIVAIGYLMSIPTTNA